MVRALLLAAVIAQWTALPTLRSAALELRLHAAEPSIYLTEDASAELWDVEFPMVHVRRILWREEPLPINMRYVATITPGRYLLLEWSVSFDVPILGRDVGDADAYVYH